MKTITINSTIAINSDTALATHMDGEVVILDTVNGKYFGLDGVGVHIWESLDTAQTVEQLKASILQEYDVDEGQCEADVIELLDGLQKAGLIIVS